MSNYVANAIDWYVNKLNTAHIIPVNAATLIRDISSKQLSDGNFTPRPLTVDNFTDRELDALYRLSHDDKTGKYRHITGDVYEQVRDKKGNLFEYGDESLGLKEYLSPLRTVSTTLGQAAVVRDGDDYKVKDTYDFNIKDIPVMEMGDGQIMAPGGNTYDSWEDFIKSQSGRRGSAYSRFRSNAARIGHTSLDPDSQKIKANISLNEIKRRLGDRLGKSDIHSPVSRKEFVLKSIAGGAAAGAPIGAMLGAVSSAMLLIDKKRRKHWLRTVLTHVLGGAAIAALVGGAGGGFMSNKVYSNFEKKSSDIKRDKKSKKSDIKSSIISALAYSLPLMALIGSAGYGYSKSKNLLGELMKDVDDNNALRMKVTDNYEEVAQF